MGEVVDIIQNIIINAETENVDILIEKFKALNEELQRTKDFLTNISDLTKTD